MRIRAVLLLLVLLVLSVRRAHAQCPQWLLGPFDNGTAANGANGSVLASTICDPDGAGPLQAGLIVAGTFTMIDGVAAQHVAYRDPTTGHWQPLGAGIVANVYALTVWNNQLVAGGGGDSNPATTDNNVLRWDGSTWQTFYGGTSTGTVYTLAVYNGQLFAGGSFVIYPTGGVPASYIARWNEGTGVWNEVNSGTDGQVDALYPWGGYLYVGGVFTTVGGASSPYFARWNSAWQPITGTAVRGVTSFSPGTNGDLLASGNFLNGNNLSAPGAGGWNGTSWTVYPTTTSNNSFYRVVAYGGSIYVGGFFTTINNVGFSHVARWDGSAWQPVAQGVNGNVWHMTVYNNELLALGSFSTAGLVPANNIARWNGYEWGSFGGGTSNGVYAMTTFRGRLVAGGNFQQFTASGPTAHDIVGWTGSGGMSAFSSGMNGTITSLKSYTVNAGTGSTDLVAGGAFSVAGGVACTNIARWNESDAIITPPSWHAMGAGLNGTVYAIERYNGITYAGGAFTQSGATSLPYIAKWNSASGLWEALGVGTNGVVNALRVYNGNLYVGGQFTSVAGVTTGHLARWNGSNWSTVGPPGGLMGNVFALEVHSGLLVVGGDFPFSFSDRLCTWDDTSFGYIGSGTSNDGIIWSLHSTGSRLYAGGDFNHLNGATAARIASWDGTSWRAMGGGANSTVYAMADMNNELHAGGYFTTVDGGSLSTPTWARHTETGVPDFATNPSSLYLAPGATATFNAVPLPGYPAYTLQWYHGSSPLADGPTGHGSTISGAHSTRLVITNTDPHTDWGNYYATVSNGCGSAASGTAPLVFDSPAGVDGPGAFATAFSALGPNPSRDGSRLVFSLARAAAVRVSVHDVAGRRVWDAELGHMGAGPHDARWESRDAGGRAVRAGVYLVSVDADGTRIGTRRIVVMR